MRKFVGLGILALSFGVVVFFQNCSNEMKSNQSWESTSTTGEESSNNQDPNPIGPTGPESPNLVKTNFAAGEAFDYGALEPRKMIQLQLDYLKYDEYENGKAVAINSDGLGFVSIKRNGQADAERSALESCYVIGGRMPCLLLAAGNQFVVSSQDLENQANFNVGLTTGVELSSDNIPFVGEAIATEIISSYSEKNKPKALAMSVDGRWVIAHSETDSNIQNKAEAIRLALERCEMTAILSPCLIVAANDAINFNPNAPLALNIDYQKTTVKGSIPGTRDRPFSDVVKPDYIDALNSNASLHGAIFIAPLGAGAAITSSTSKKDASDRARTLCESNNDSEDYSCFKYADGLNLLSVKDQLRGLKDYSTLHCGVVPRLSCEAHADMGCSDGEFYLFKQNGMGVELADCP